MWRLAISQTSQLELIKSITVLLLHIQPYWISYVSGLFSGINGIIIASIILIKCECSSHQSCFCGIYLMMTTKEFISMKGGRKSQASRKLKQTNRSKQWTDEMIKHLICMGLVSSRDICPPLKKPGRSTNYGKGSSLWYVHQLSWLIWAVFLSFTDCV